MKAIFNTLYRFISKLIHESWAVISPKSYVKYLYKKILHRDLDIENPKDYNEKLEWLKIYSDMSLWTKCADKYEVRDYVIQCGLEKILVPLYGCWKDARYINFDNLPEKFVLKTNNAFGRSIIVTDKSKLDIVSARKQLNKWVRDRYGLMSFEPHYWKIKRVIIAEKYLQNDSITAPTSLLVDYKFWCIHGEPDIIMILYDRQYFTDGTKIIDQKMRACVFDLDWNIRPDIISGFLAKDEPPQIPRPQCLDEMINICRILSKPFVTVRVDLYEVDGKVYFGELTFTPGGHKNYFTEEYFLKMGQKIDLSRAERRTGRMII
jgi:hypothetical protein